MLDNGYVLDAIDLYDMADVRLYRESKNRTDIKKRLRDKDLGLERNAHIRERDRGAKVPADRQTFPLVFDTFNVSVFLSSLGLSVHFLLCSLPDLMYPLVPQKHEVVVALVNQQLSQEASSKPDRQTQLQRLMALARSLNCHQRYREHQPALQTTMLLLEVRENGARLGCRSMSLSFVLAPADLLLFFAVQGG